MEIDADSKGKIALADITLRQPLYEVSRKYSFSFE